MIIERNPDTALQSEDCNLVDPSDRAGGLNTRTSILNNATALIYELCILRKVSSINQTLTLTTPEGLNIL